MRACRATTAPRARPSTPTTSSRASARVPRAVDPASNPYETTQLVSVAGTVAALGLTALVLGARGEPAPCAACASTGGESCAFCDGTGRRATPAVVTKRERNDDGVLGLTRRNPYECTACKGSGLIMCRRCRGSGYV